MAFGRVEIWLFYNNWLDLQNKLWSKIGNRKGANFAIVPL